MIRKQISAFIYQRSAAQVFKLFWERKRKRHHSTQEGDAFDHLKVAQQHRQEKIRVFNIIFMNVQCSDSCSSFGVPAICCYFITRTTSTVFRKLTLDSSNAPTI